MNNKVNIEIDSLALKDLHFGCEHVLALRKIYLTKITQAEPKETFDKEIKIEKERIKVLEEARAIIENALINTEKEN